MAGLNGLGEWGPLDREWTQGSPPGVPCVPPGCDPATGLPLDPRTGRPQGLAGDPGFHALLRAVGSGGQALNALARPASGASFLQLAPHQGAPFRAQPLPTPFTRAVMQCTSAAPGFMSANAVAMALAEGLPGATLSVLPPTTGIGGQQLLVSSLVPMGYRGVLTHVGVEISDSRKSAVLFTVVVGGPTTQVANTMSGGQAIIDPSPLAEYSTLTDPLPIQANVTENTTIQIWARSTDGDAPVLVAGKLFGYIYPVLQQSDSLSSSLGQTPCAPQFTNRLDCPPCGPGGM